MSEQHYRFDSLEGLYNTAAGLPKADRHDMYAHRGGDWEPIGWRDSLWLDGYGAVGDVSASEDYYNVIQYGDVLDAVGNAVEQYDGAIEVSGYTTLSSSGHKMSTRVNFYGDTDIEVVEGDAINLGLKIRSGHSGYHALKYDVGAERQICSNGMIAFASELHFEQSHQDQLDYGLARQAVGAVVEGAEEIEDRMREARQRRFHSEDEAVLVMHDLGLNQYFDDPVDTFRDALDAELETAGAAPGAAEDGQPSLYDTYNAATRALTHETDDLPQHRRDEGLERAAQLLDYGTYGMPDAEYLGQQAVERRVHEFVDDEAEPYFDGEEETLQELVAVRGVGDG